MWLVIAASGIFLVAIVALILAAAALARVSAARHLRVAHLMEVSEEVGPLRTERCDPRAEECAFH